MRTPGSGAEGGAPRAGAPDARTPLTPASDVATPAAAREATPPAARPPVPRRTSTGVFRWRGIAPLLVLLGLLVAGYVLFADRMVRETLAEAATKALGTQVDIAALRILEDQTALELDGVQVADPFDPTRNLLEVQGVRLEMEREPLLQKKFVIRRLAIRRVRTGTRRAVAAKPVKGGGFAPEALRAVEQWKRQFDVPVLRLSTFDTVKSLVLDPRQLGTVKAAVALRDRADSTKDAIEAELRQLRLRETVDDARATVERLRAVEPKSLDLVSARAVVADVRRAVDSVNAARRRVQALDRSARLGIASLRDGVGMLDSARRADYAFARGLLALPTVEAPEIGNALFGPVTIDRFQRMLYYSELARGYVPPGLQPKETAGPERLRRSGTTVQFASRQAYPDFLLRRADVDFELIGNAATSGRYVLAIGDVTTQPALVGRPMRFALERRGGTSRAVVDVRGQSDRRGAPTDVVRASAAGIALPAFDLPKVPFRLELNQGTSALAFSRRGDGVNGTWTVKAPAISWRADSARIRGASYLEGLVYRVIGGLRELELEARITGTLAEPAVAVRSNLDRAIADRLRAVLGEELKRGEALARAKVDSIVRDKEAEARVKVEALRSDAEAKLADAQARLDAEREKLEAEKVKLEERLRALAGGVVGVPGLPGIPKATIPKLPSIPPLPGRKPAPAPADTTKPDTSATAP